jgi:hypothetical protein
MKKTKRGKEKMKTITKAELITMLDKLLETNMPILLNTNRELGEMGNLNEWLPSYAKNRCFMFEVVK